jgi:hypothetical protein
MKTTFVYRISLTVALSALISMGTMASVNDDKVELSIKKQSNSEISASSSESSWAFDSQVSEIIDSYSSFIFRTKKSQSLDQVKFLVEVDSFGKIVGFELIDQEDKGLKERLDYVVRQLPDCKPVVGSATYKPETFEISISK